jgi:ATP-dependent Clp protease, protease subunit
MPEILIYSDIGESWFSEGVTAKSVKSQLDSMKDATEITVRINSPGGDVFDGFAIYNLLAQHPAEITVKVDGMAASAASVIAMAGDKIEMAANAMMMIHNPWTMAMGDAESLGKTITLLDQIKGSILTTYATKASLSEDELSELMDAETWFDAQGAIDAGLATAIIGKSDKAKAKNTAKPWIRNAPQEAEEAARHVDPVDTTPAKPEFRIAARQRFPIS